LAGTDAQPAAELGQAPVQAGLDRSLGQGQPLRRLRHGQVGKQAEPHHVPVLGPELSDGDGDGGVLGDVGVDGGSRGDPRQPLVQSARPPLAAVVIDGHVDGDPGGPREQRPLARGVP
jgi:hypothetical protein